MAPPPLRIAVLLVAHNRREMTVRAVRSLGSTSRMDLRIVLFDDASSDGTADAVLELEPDAIIVRGDGNAFWNGGLYRAWQRALELDVDGFLWLNDDVALDADALDRLARYWCERPEREFILVGATRSRDGRLTYGGMSRIPHPLALKLPLQPMSDSLRRIDTFNGNIVLVPRTVVERIGINDPGYFHKFGDVDYGLTATAAGIASYILPDTLGVCETNPPFDLGALSLQARWKHINSHKGLPMAGWWRLTRRHSGAWFLPHFLLAYRRLFYPRKRAA